MSENAGPKTFVAGEALAARRRVKIKNATTTTPPEVVYADAGEDFIGVTVFAAASGDDVTVKLQNEPGTFEIECLVDSAIVRGTVLYGANDGMVSDAASGTAQGISMEVGADNAHIEVAPWNVKSTTAATVSVADTAGHTAQTTVEAAIAEIYANMFTAQATIPVPLSAITLEDGTALTKQATTATGIAQLANKEQVIMVPVSGASVALGFSIPVPQDLDDTADITIHALVGKDADNDVLTLDCEVFPVGVGDLANADIQATAAQAIVATGTELVFTCGADGVLAAPGALTGVLTVGGTNDGDAVYVYGAWIEYKRKLLTA